MVYINVVRFFFKQKTAYEMRISDWSSDVCSSDLQQPPALPCLSHSIHTQCPTQTQMNQALHPSQLGQIHQQLPNHTTSQRSEEHTSELQSLMRISYAVFCLKKKKKTKKKI